LPADSAADFAGGADENAGVSRVHPARRRHGWGWDGHDGGLVAGDYAGGRKRVVQLRVLLRGNRGRDGGAAQEGAVEETGSAIQAGALGGAAGDGAAFAGAV